MRDGRKWAGERRKRRIESAKGKKRREERAKGEKKREEEWRKIEQEWKQLRRREMDYLRLLGGRLQTKEKLNQKLSEVRNGISVRNDTTRPDLFCMLLSVLLPHRCCRSGGTIQEDKP